MDRLPALSKYPRDAMCSGRWRGDPSGGHEGQSYLNRQLAMSPRQRLALVQRVNSVNVWDGLLKIKPLTISLVARHLALVYKIMSRA